MHMIYELQRVAGKTQWEKAWISVENEEFLSKAVHFWDFSLGVGGLAHPFLRKDSRGCPTLVSPWESLP